MLCNRRTFCIAFFVIPFGWLLISRSISLTDLQMLFSMSCLVIEHYTHIRYFKGFLRLLKRFTQFFTQPLLIVFQPIQFTFFDWNLPSFNLNDYLRIIKNNSIDDPPLLFLHCFVLVDIIPHSSFKFPMSCPFH